MGFPMSTSTTEQPITQTIPLGERTLRVDVIGATVQISAALHPRHPKDYYELATLTADEASVLAYSISQAAMLAKMSEVPGG
jgi:hypothetical protein